MNHHFTARVLRVTLVVSALVCVSPSQTINAPNSSNGTVVLPQGTAFVAELAKSIDVRKAQAGDAVKAKIVQDVISNGQIVIHRGAMLLGHVTDAKVMSQQESQSVLGVVFDKVALKHGQELSLKAVLQALAPPLPEQGPLASSSYDGSKGGRDPGWVIDPRERRDHTRNDALTKAADPNSYGHSADTLHNGLLSSGNRGVFGMPGVSLKSGPGTPEPELISTKADIKLERGTQMILAVMASR